MGSYRRKFILISIGPVMTRYHLRPPLDQKFRDNGHLGIGSRLPAVISGDIVGEVIGGGPSNRFSPGTHVFSQALLNLPQGGGLQEYTILNGEYAAAVPDGIPDVEAALYPINIVTAAMSVFSSAGFGFPLPETDEAVGFDYAAQNVVIIGGGTNTGKLAVQLCQLAGIGTIVVIAGPANENLLKEFGATHFIARQDTDVEEQVRGIVGDNLQYVYDTFTFGDLSLGASLLSNSKKGIFAHNGIGQIPDTVLAMKQEGLEDKRILGFSHFIPSFGRSLWEKVPGWLSRGQIKPLTYKIIEGLDVEKVNYALDEYAAGRSGERYHVRIT
ncbi:Dehydrogenase [Penicillium tannophilum]|nr:Dehydrogenase [Penicillium tannophilum]